MKHFTYLIRVIESCKTQEQLMDAEFWAYGVICKEFPFGERRNACLTNIITRVRSQDRKLQWTI
jgi:hypothetical protein